MGNELHYVEAQGSHLIPFPILSLLLLLLLVYLVLAVALSVCAFCCCFYPFLLKKNYFYFLSGMSKSDGMVDDTSMS